MTKHPLLACALLVVLSPAFAETLTGAGATFPLPIYTRWFAAFHERYPQDEVTYQPTGSAEGIRKLREGAIDFAGSDIPLDDHQMSEMGRSVLHFPTVLGAVVPIYHIGGLSKDLNFTPETLAKIFLGTIRRWNDPEIRAANPHVRLPDAPIVVVHRSDGSGTTYVLSSYLTKVSADWKAQAGIGATVQWPVGIEASGNGGVAGLVRHTANSIGYVEFIYALQQHLGYGLVRNGAGRFVQANLDSISAAARSLAAISPDLRNPAIGSSADDAYPITGFSYLLIPSTLGGEKAAAAKRLLNWILTSGQAQSPALGYAPLPASVIEAEKAVIDRIR